MQSDIKVYNLYCKHLLAGQIKLVNTCSHFAKMIATNSIKREIRYITNFEF